MAANASTEPSESPYQAFCSAPQSARPLCIEATASLCFLHRRRAVRRHVGQQRDRVLVAATADHADGVNLVGVGGIVEVEHDGGARLVQRLLDARVGLPGNGLIEGRQCIGVARLEHRLCGFQALVRLAHHQGQGTVRRFDRPP
jgi:hypothetical protein